MMQETLLAAQNASQPLTYSTINVSHVGNTSPHALPVIMSILLATPAQLEHIEEAEVSSVLHAILLSQDA